MPHRKKLIDLIRQPTGPSISPEVKVEEPPGGTQYSYVNGVYVTWTPFDLTTRFSQLIKIEPGPPQKFTYSEKAVVTMAWSEAKYFLSILQEAIANYERVNGELKIPPDLKLPPA